MKTFHIFDAHLHIIDLAFPLLENQGFLPADFTVPDYLDRLSSRAELRGGAVS